MTLRSLALLKAWHALGPVDARTVLRDSLLVGMALVPPGVAVALRFGLPALRDPLLRLTGYDLTSAGPSIVGYAALALVPILLAMIVGFLIIDERDAGLTRALAVTPLRPSSYAAYRLSLPFFLAWAGAMVVALAAGADRPGGPGLVLITALGALGAPLFGLALGSLAADKVQGMALIKVASALQILPLAGVLIGGPWAWLGAPVPSFWPLAAWLAAVAQGPTEGVWLPLAIGAAVHTILLWAVFQRFRKVAGR